MLTWNDSQLTHVINMSLMNPLKHAAVVDRLSEQILQQDK